MVEPIGTGITDALVGAGDVDQTKTKITDGGYTTEITEKVEENLGTETDVSPCDTYCTYIWNGTFPECTSAGTITNAI